MAPPNPRPPERDYSHRGVVDKLGIKAGQIVAFDEQAAAVPDELHAEILGRAISAALESLVDVVVAMVYADSDCVAVLGSWKPRLVQNGGIWLLTPKRGQPGYVDQRNLINDGAEAGLVDNKVCSVSDTTSAMRFVIRRADRR